MLVHAGRLPSRYYFAVTSHVRCCDCVSRLSVFQCSCLVCMRRECPVPITPQTTSQYKDPRSVQFCSYTAQPTSTINASVLPFTSCQVTTKWPLATSVCECSGEGTSILYPTGTQNCVFSSVPTATASLPTLASQNCQRTCLYGGPCYACEYDGSSIVSRHAEIEIKGGKANASLSSRLSALSRIQTRLMNSVCMNTVLLGIHVHSRFSHYHHRAVFPCDRRKLLSLYRGELQVLAPRAGGPGGESSSSLCGYTTQPLPMITMFPLPSTVCSPTYWGPVDSPSSFCLCCAKGVGALKFAYSLKTTSLCTCCIQHGINSIAPLMLALRRRRRQSHWPSYSLKHKSLKYTCLQRNICMNTMRQNRSTSLHLQHHHILTLNNI